MLLWVDFFWNSVPQCSALGCQVQRFHYCHVFLILTTSLKHLQSMIPSTEEKRRSWQRHQSWKLLSLDIGEWIALCWMFLILLTKKLRLLATFASLKKQQQPACIGWQLGALHSRLYIDRRHPFMQLVVYVHWCDIMYVLQCALFIHDIRWHIYIYKYIYI